MSKPSTPKITARGSPPQRRATHISRKREHIERAPLGRALRQIAHRVDEALRPGAVARIEIVRDDRAGPPADAREDRDVFLAVRAAIRNRLADDPGACLELPQE